MLMVHEQFELRFVVVNFNVRKRFQLVVALLAPNKQTTKNAASLCENAVSLCDDKVDSVTLANDNNNRKNDESLGAIVGGVVGGSVCAIVVVVVV